MKAIVPFACIAVAALIDGTGTLCLASKGRLLNIGSDRGRRTLTLAGNGEEGYADGTGAAAKFYWPSGVAVDARATSM
ncbi:MAG: hypothetical protein LBP20_09765 [Treponema sp.]|jgi:hypothetical protein|nr:hypothetical protein [Treponema sp.]